jgi:hypothetical protein
VFVYIVCRKLRDKALHYFALRCQKDLHFFVNGVVIYSALRIEVSITFFVGFVSNGSKTKGETVGKTTPLF